MIDPARHKARIGPMGDRPWGGTRMSAMPRTPAEAGVTAVVNGTATGAGEPDALLESVLGELGRAGVRADGVVTGSEEELGAVLAGAGDRRVVLIGGDGTLH